MVILTMWLFWLVIGLSLIGAELFIPGLVAGSMGTAALIASALAWLSWPVWSQGLIWLGLSSGFAMLSRRLVPKTSTQIEDDKEARAVSFIPAGQVGRAAYLGSTWNARCSIPDVDIREGQDLFIVERKGNTLIVMPASLLHG